MMSVVARDEGSVTIDPPYCSGVRLSLHVPPLRRSRDPTCVPYVSFYY